MQKKSGRAIVDPTAWDSTEVGSSEANAIQAFGACRKNAVSSIRSGLFKRNAKSITDRFNSLSNIGEYRPIFKNTRECAPLEEPFKFEHITSLEYCEYGRTNKKIWTKDIFAVVHNAVRSELNDLTEILRSVQKIGVRLRADDFKKIREWWLICSGVLLDFFDVETKHLFPWITTAIESAKDASSSVKFFVKGMPERQKMLRDLVASVSKAFSDLCDSAALAGTKDKQETSNAKKAMLVIHSLDDLVTETCGYMMDQEVRLPTTLKSVYKSEKKDRDGVLTKVITSLGKNGKKADTFLVLLTRWMPDAKTTKSFTKTLVGIHECNYAGLQTQFEVHHAGIVHQFQVRAGI